MGKITRHGISSSVFMYFGLILGFINATILFPKFLGKEIYGFCQFLIQMSEMLAVFSLLGMPNVTIRFFSRFRDPANQHDGYLGFLMSVVGLGTLISTLLLIVARPLFVNWFGDGRSGPYIDQFYWGLVAMFVFTNINLVFISYATALQRPRVPTFFLEVGGRLITFALILAFYLHWIDQMEFIGLFSLKLIPITLGLVLFLYLIGELHPRINLQILRRPVFKEMVDYGGYAIFAQIGGRLINRIDMIMIGALLSWGEVGIYSVFFFVSIVIAMPHDGMGRIVNPMIAEYWQEDEPEKIASLYRRMALNNWVPAVLIFAGIVANLENAVLLLGEDYRPGTSVAIFLGVAQLGHVINGYNGMVLVHSKLYRYDLIFKLITALITVITNYLFIKWMGLAGAAVATALTILLRNVLVQLFVYRKLNMHPFSIPMLYVAAIGLLTLGIGLGLPRMPGHFVWDILVRSGLMTITFGGLILGFNIAPDLTRYLREMIQKIK